MKIVAKMDAEKYGRRSRNGKKYTPSFETLERVRMRQNAFAFIVPDLALIEERVPKSVQIT